MGEAGAVVVLEALEHSLVMSTKMYAKLKGSRSFIDSAHVT